MSKKAEAVVAADVASDEFQRMLDALDIEIEALDDDDQKKFDENKAVVIKGICSGRITMSEEGLPTVALKYPVDSITSLTFKFPTAASLVAFGDSKSTNKMTQAWKCLEDLTGVPSAIIGKMRKRPDFEVLETLLTLFLAA